MPASWSINVRVWRTLLRWLLGQQLDANSLHSHLDCVFPLLSDVVQRLSSLRFLVWMYGSSHGLLVQLGGRRSLVAVNLIKRGWFLTPNRGISPSGFVLISLTSMVLFKRHTTVSLRQSLITISRVDFRGHNWTATPINSRRPYHMLNIADASLGVVRGQLGDWDGATMRWQVASLATVMWSFVPDRRWIVRLGPKVELGAARVLRSGWRRLRSFDFLLLILLSETSVNTARHLVHLVAKTFLSFVKVALDVV